MRIAYAIWPRGQADAKRTWETDFTGFSESGVVTFCCRHDDAHPLPDCRLQKCRASRPRGAETLRAALHPFPGIQLFGDAQGDCPGQCSARTAARNHAVHHGKRREVSAGGDQRNAADRRSKGPHPEHFSDPDESARESRSRQYAFLTRAQRGIPLVLEPSVIPQNFRNGFDELCSDVTCVERAGDGWVRRTFQYCAAIAKDGHLVRWDSKFQQKVVFLYREACDGKLCGKRG